jgi:hypothetical protein
VGANGAVAEATSLPVLFHLLLYAVWSVCRVSEKFFDCPLQKIPTSVLSQVRGYGPLVSRNYRPTGLQQLGGWEDDLFDAGRFEQ